MKDHLFKLIKGSAIYGVGIVLNQLLNILLLPLFTKYLNPTDYGIAAVLSTFSLVLFNVFSLGFGASIGLIFYELDNKTHRNNTIWTAFYSLAIISALACISGVIFKNQISYLLFNTSTNSTYVLLTLISAFSSIIVIPFILKLQFEEKQVIFVVLTIINTLVTILLNILLIIILKRGITGRIEATTISALFYFVLFIIPSLKYFGKKIDIKISVSLIKYGLPMIPAFISLYLIQQGNIYFITKFHSLKITGLYSIGNSFGNGIMLVITAFTTAFYPFAMSLMDKKEEAKKILGKILTYYIFGVGFVSLQFYIFAKPIVILFTQPEFLDSYKIIGIISSSLYFMAVFNIVMIPIYYVKDIKYITIIEIITSILYVVFAVFAIRNFDLIGGALSLLLAYLILGLLTYLWSKSKKEKYIQVHYEWKRIFTFLLFYFVCVLFILKIKLFQYPYEIIFNSISSILMIFVIWQLLTVEEKKWITKFLQKCKFPFNF